MKLYQSIFQVNRKKPFFGAWPGKINNCNQFFCTQWRRDSFPPAHGRRPIHLHASIQALDGVLRIPVVAESDEGEATRHPGLVAQKDGLFSEF